MADDQEPWVPRSREDWADVFSMGMHKYRTERAEQEAKEAAENPPKTEDDPPAKKKSFVDYLLGS